MADNAYDTIIVGGGIAGLTAAAFLAREKRRVLLIEKNKECGGLVGGFVRDGFHFDAGVRALLDAGIVFPMLKSLGLALEVVQSPVSVGIEKDIFHVEGPESLAAYGDLLKRHYPESGGEIDRVIRLIRKIMKAMDVLYGVENPSFKDPKRDRSYLLRELLPWLPKLLLTVRKINRMSGPVEEYLGRIVTNPALKDIISQHFFRNTPAFFAMSYFSLYLDYFYPQGGTGRLPEALRNRILALGGEIKTETRIVEVKARERLVKDQSQATYEYGDLVWAADLKTLYAVADTSGFPPKIIRKIESRKDALAAHRGGDSVFTLFLEVDAPLESFRAISHGHFFYTPSKAGLGETHRQELDRLLRDWDRIDKAAVVAWLDRFTKLNTYEISIPGLKDPALAPAGKTGLIVSCLAEYDLFRKAREAGWHDELKAELADRMLDVLGDSIYPSLKEKVMARFITTPLSIEERIGSSEGAITGWSFQEPVPVVNKILSGGRAVRTPIPSIYQAGQWTYSPAGVPMSILTGKLAADRILSRKKRA